MHIRLSVALALVWLALLTPASALAWQEAHQTGADVRMRVEPNGVASIALQLRWRVVHGPLRFVDIAGVDPAAVLGPAVHVVAEDGREVPARAARLEDRTVRVTFDDLHSLAHGAFALDLPMQVDLVATQAIVRDGARWRLSWAAPVASDGFDGAITRLELPAAPDPPQPIVDRTGAVDESAGLTLRREPAEDILELSRPHVTRGEAPAWTVRFDPRGMTQVIDPRLRPPPEAPPKEPNRVRESTLTVGLAGLAIAFALLVAHKSRGFRVACAERTARPRSLLPLPDPARAALAGAALAAAVGLEVADATWAAAACIAVATLAASLRAPVARPAARGPGRWLVLRPQDAFGGAHAGVTDRRTFLWMDASTVPGRIAAAVVAVLVAAAALTVAQFDRSAPWLALLDAAPLLPLFVTGTASQLPPHPARSAARWMASAFRRLRSIETLRVAPWARMAAQPPGPDELRLLVLPRAAMPGLVGVELGLAWCSTPVGWTARPEVLARVIEGTPAAAKLASELPSLRLVPGRRPDERVAVLPPRYPTRRGGISLARALAGALTDRRVSYPPRVWTAPERRVPPARSGSPASDAAA